MQLSRSRAMQLTTDTLTVQRFEVFRRHRNRVAACRRILECLMCELFRVLILDPELRERVWDTDRRAQLQYPLKHASERLLTQSQKRCESNHLVFKSGSVPREHVRHDNRISESMMSVQVR